MAADGAAQDALAAFSEFGPALAAKLGKESIAKHREALLDAIDEVDRASRTVEASTQVAAYLAPTNGELGSWSTHSARKGRLFRPQVPRKDALTFGDLLAVLRQSVVDAEVAERPKSATVVAA